MENFEKIDYSVKLFEKAIEIADNKRDDRLRELVIQSKKLDTCLKCIHKIFDLIDIDKFIIDKKIDLNPDEYSNFDCNGEDDKNILLTAKLGFELYKLDMKRNLKNNEAFNKRNKK